MADDLGLAEDREAQRERAVRRVAGAGRHPLGDLALDQEHQPLEGPRGQGTHHHRRGDVVGQVRDELRALRQDSEVVVEGIGRHDLHVGEPLQREGEDGQQPLVEFERPHGPRAGGQLAGQHAEPRTHLEHGVGGAELGRGDDRFERAAVDEEVLPEALVGAQPKAIKHRGHGAAVGQILGGAVGSVDQPMFSPMSSLSSRLAADSEVSLTTASSEASIAFAVSSTSRSVAARPFSTSRCASTPISRASS